MKCTVCGCEDLEEIEIINDQVLKTEGFVEQTVSSFACTKCGHVELYLFEEGRDGKDIVNKDFKIR